MASRAIAPGELVVLTISVAGRPSSVRVSVFRKDIRAYKLTDDRWQALVGIDLAQRPGRYVATIDADLGSTVVHGSQPLVVQPKKFPTRSLKVDPEFVNPPAAQLSRISQEATFLHDTYASSAAGRLWAEPFVRPVPGEANSRFGSRSVFNGEPRSAHGGADFLSPAGTPIKAPNAGRIVCARDLFFTGNTVIVDHGLGMFSLLAHMSRMDVREGEMVTAGQVVGLVGATGRVTGPHLHWALNVWGARVDPLSALAVFDGRD
jgi:murein DD-endopeptidase MepM/ murein hydrolase activator NlpD